MIEHDCTFCHYTTFLPIKCVICSKNFCEKHFQPEKHGCTVLIKNNVLPQDNSKFQCINKNCKSHITFVCNCCNKYLCSKHRFSH